LADRRAFAGQAYEAARLPLADVVQIDLIHLGLAFVEHSSLENTAWQLVVTQNMALTLFLVLESDSFAALCLKIHRTSLAVPHLASSNDTLASFAASAWFGSLAFPDAPASPDLTASFGSLETLDSLAFAVVSFALLVLVEMERLADSKDPVHTAASLDNMGPVHTAASLDNTGPVHTAASLDNMDQNKG
jgi:hypothetical protein